MLLGSILVYSAGRISPNLPPQAFIADRQGLDTWQEAFLFLSGLIDLRLVQLQTVHNNYKQSLYQSFPGSIMPWRFPTQHRTEHHSNVFKAMARRPFCRRRLVYSWYAFCFDWWYGSSGVSILLSMMGSVALLVAAAYLRASFRHERELKLSVSTTTQ